MNDETTGVTFCGQTGAVAVNGACPAHHGDACLVFIPPDADDQERDIQPGGVVTLENAVLYFLGLPPL